MNAQRAADVLLTHGYDAFLEWMATNKEAFLIKRTMRQWRKARLSEGQCSKLLGIDRVSARRIRKAMEGSK